MTMPIVRQDADALGGLIHLVVDSVSSPHSKRAYAHAIGAFFEWCSRSGVPGLTKATVQAYKSELEARALSPATINLAMSAIRKLATEAADNGLLAPELAAGVARVKGVRRAGIRLGTWLTLEDAERMLGLPVELTLTGKRDRAMLVLLIGAGLRRTETAGLELEQVQQRDGRWVIADLTGKGKRVRTVPIPSWAKVVLDDWTEAAGLVSGPVFRPIDKSGRIRAGGLSPQSVFNIVRGYSSRLGVKVAPHDLRRTFAKLAHTGRAALEQIQFSLGHASLLTTERYLGLRQNLGDAPCDHLGVRLQTGAAGSSPGR